MKCLKILKNDWNWMEMDKNKEFEKQIKQVIEDYQSEQEEKTIREHGCKITNVLYDKTKILEKIIVNQEQEIKVLKGQTKEVKEDKKIKVVAWVFLSGIIMLFTFSLITMIYTIHKG